MVSKSGVAVRGDVLLKTIGEIDEDKHLQEIFGRPVSEALVVAADGSDLRIENGGLLKLSKEQSAKFLHALSRVVGSAGADCVSGGIESERATSERVRVRCDVLAAILRALSGNKELEALFGMPVLEAVVGIAEEGDFRIESAPSIRLTDSQSGVFLGILNKVVNDNTF